MKQIITAISMAALFGLTACSGAETSTASTDVAAAPAVQISNARIRPPLPGRTMAAAYFRLDSISGDKLLAVTSPVSERVELHNHIDDNGIMRMRRVGNGVEIPKEGSVEFQEGGYHVMLFDTSIQPDTKDVALTFDFEKSEDVTVIVEIEDMSSPAAAHGSGTAKGEDDKGPYGSGH